MKTEVRKDGTPAVYVACLASYNAGRLHGRWIDLEDNPEPEDIDAEIQAMLAESPEPGAEEWAVHDYENMPNPGEFASVADLVRLAGPIVAHGEAWLAYCAAVGEDYATPEGFESEYIGLAEDAKAYAWDLAEQEFGERVAHYFDIDAYLRDLAQSYHFVDGREGCHVFTR